MFVSALLLLFFLLYFSFYIIKIQPSHFRILSHAASKDIENKKNTKNAFPTECVHGKYETLARYFFWIATLQFKRKKNLKKIEEKKQNS